MSSIQALMEDNDLQHIVKNELGKELLRKELVLEDPLAQIMALTSLAPFSESNRECSKVAFIVYWGVNKVKTKEENGRADVLPMISKHEGKELAYRCLIARAFFKGALMDLHERRAAPKPEYYYEAGVNAFYSINEKEIGNHFKKWELFLQTVFI